MAHQRYLRFAYNEGMAQNDIPQIGPSKLSEETAQDRGPF